MIAAAVLQERPVPPVQTYREVKPPRVRFQLLNKQAELYASAEAWHELNEASASPEAMLDPSWLLVWWRHYGAGIQLAVGLVYADDVLVGLAPLCVRPYRYRPGLVFRRLQFMGIDANESDGVCSEYMSFIARAGYEEIVAREFVDQIVRGGFGSWHEAVFSAMRGDTAMTSLIEGQLARHNLACTRSVPMQGYYVTLPKTWEEYLKSLTVKRRYSIKSALDKFQDWAGDRPWRLDHSLTQESLKGALQNLIALHGERWSEDGKDGVFASPRFTAFHRDYVAAMVKAGGVDIATLFVADAPVAAVYTIRQGSRVMTYQNGRTVGVPSRVRLGIAINALMIQHAIARGDREYDFMAGDAVYKQEFSTSKRPIVSLRAARPTVREFVRLGLISARDRVTTAVKAIRRPPATIAVPAAKPGAPAAPGAPGVGPA